MHKDWSQEHKVLVLAGISLLSAIGIFATVTQSAKSSTETAVANTKLAGSLDSLRRSSEASMRLNSLNSQLQERLLAQGDTIANLARAGIGSATGGNSFCHLEFIMGPSDQAGAPLIIHHGRYPLYSVNARVVDITKMLATKPADLAKNETYLNPGDFRVGGYWYNLDHLLPFSDTGTQRFRVFFWARNGGWIEDLRYVKINNKWERAMRITQDKVKQSSTGPNTVMFEDVSKQFPKTSGGRMTWVD